MNKAASSRATRAWYRTNLRVDVLIEVLIERRIKSEEPVA
jgi:hypothetical protein